MHLLSHALQAGCLGVMDLLNHELKQSVGYEFMTEPGQVEHIEHFSGL